MFSVRKSICWSRDYAFKIEDKGKRSGKRDMRSSEDSGLQFRMILMYGRITLQEGDEFY